MDENRSSPSNVDATQWMRLAGAAALGMLALFLLVGTLFALKSYRYIGSGVAASNTITVSGEGEVFAVPDTATFSVTVQEKNKEVKVAQEAATKKTNDIIAYLEDQGIDEKDIQTTDYSVYPQYDYIQGACRDGICPPGRQVLNGFEVSQTLTIKVRDTEQAGDLLSGVGSRGASSVSGLSFTIDDQDALENEAREKAISQAEEKAEALADSLGVDIVRIVGFNESGSYPPMPYAARGGVALDMAESTKLQSSPELPVGQNKIISSVSVTYEIR